MAKPPPKSPYDANPGSWDRVKVLVFFIVAAAVFGLIAFFCGSR